MIPEEHEMTSAAPIRKQSQPGHHHETYLAQEEISTDYREGGGIGSNMKI